MMSRGFEQMTRGVAELNGDGIIVVPFFITWMVLVFPLMFCLMLDTPKIADAAPYWLSGPNEYSAFSGDIHVSYVIADEAVADSKTGQQPKRFRVKLVEIRHPGREEVAIVKKDVPKNTTVGRIVFPCGIVDRAGRIAFVLVTSDEDTVLARSDEVLVSWPKVMIHVPLLVETYTSDVEIRLDLLPSGESCSPRQKGDYDIFLHLVYLGPSPPSAEEGLSWYHSTVILSRRVSKWFLVKNAEINIECWNFDRPGVYQVSLHAPTIEASPHIATSENFRVFWSRSYSVNVPYPSIYPCQESLTVVYNYPRCSGDSDRLRIYGRPLSAARHLSDHLEYMSELRLSRGKHSLQVPCKVFSGEYYEFCLAYVSVARNGAVFEVKSQCRPRSIDPGGGPTWGEWSQWSPCSATCGSSVQSRYRLCNKENGHQCSGLPTQTEPCLVPECPDNFATTTESSYLGRPKECRCGCTIHIVQNGTLEMVRPDISRCGNHSMSSVIWYFSAWPQGEVRILFTEVHLMMKEASNGKQQQWISIRDGKTPVSPLLGIISSSSEEFDMVPAGPFTSTSSTLRVELHKGNYSSAVVMPNNIASGTDMLFNISYFRLGNIDDSGINIILSSRAKPSALAAVHTTTVIVLSLVAVTTLALAALYRFYWLRRSKSAGSCASDSISCSSMMPEHYRGTGGKCSHVRLLHPSTSLSDISASPLSLKRHSEIPDLSTLSEDETDKSPEDFMNDSFIFRSDSVDSVKSHLPGNQKNHRTSRDPHLPLGPSGAAPPSSSTSPQNQDLRLVIKKQLPVATVSPQPQLRRGLIGLHVANSREEVGAAAHNLRSHLVTSPVRWREKTRDKGARNPSISQASSSCQLRDSSAPLTASLSEFSLNTTINSEDGFEYDYYDYGCHDLPGSFFCQDPSLTEWPPFIPIPPNFLEDGLPLQLFSPSESLQSTGGESQKTPQGTDQSQAEPPQSNTITK